MIVTYPWPVPSANIDPTGLTAAFAARPLPETSEETGTLRPSQVEHMVCWTRRERLRMLWYRLRLATGASYHTPSVGPTHAGAGPSRDPRPIRLARLYRRS
jgi:hypothetical protein